jgi:hypothetical protein
VAGRPPPVRQQLRLLRQPRNDGPLLQVLSRPAAATTRAGGNLPAFVSWSRNSCGGLGLFRPHALAVACVERAVRVLPEARGTDGVRMPVRRHLLRRAPVPGAPRVRVRLQGPRPRRHRARQPRRQGRQAQGQDLTGRAAPACKSPALARGSQSCCYWCSSM